MFYLFHHEISELPQPSVVKLLPHDRYLGEFYNTSPKIWGPSPKKVGAKNMKN